MAVKQRPLNIIPLRITRGEYLPVTMVALDAAGAARDLTGCTVRLWVTTAKGDATEDLVLITGAGITHLTQLGATLGQFLIEFSSAQAFALALGVTVEKTYVYDVWVFDALLRPQPVVDPSPLKVVLGNYMPAI